MNGTTAYETDFPGLPPFPDNVPTAPLRRLDLQKLIDNDSAENERLWEACTRLGFFYLDVRGATGEPFHPSNSTQNGHAATNGTAARVSNIEAKPTPTIDGARFLQNADLLFDVSKEFFDLPIDEKVSYDLSSKGSYFGYKGYGDGIVDRIGTKDRNEFYNTSKDDILGLSEPLPNPPVLKSYRKLFSSYMTDASKIVNLILARINSSLDLPQDSQGGFLPSLHRLYSRSGDQVRFVRAIPQPINDRQTALGAHTDFGSITLLFNKLGGLQVYPPPGVMSDAGEECQDWMYVRPLPGHCIINLGDAMVKFTAGILRSATHRVVNPPGEEQGNMVRYSLVYFARPEDEVMLKVLKAKGSSLIDEAAAGMEERGEPDEEVTAKDWTLRRALGRRGVGDIKHIGGTETAGSAS